MHQQDAMTVVWSTMQKEAPSRLLNVDLQNYEEAKSQALWVEAMNEELKTLEKNDNWRLVSTPSHKIIIGCK